MEWVDDVQLFMRKGGGSPQAYQIATPLLADIAASLKVGQLVRTQDNLVILHGLQMHSCIHHYFKVNLFSSSCNLQGSMVTSTRSEGQLFVCTICGTVMILVL